MIAVGAKGIIIGNDSVVQAIFQQYSKKQIVAFAGEISGKYPEVILHVGRKYPFDKGGFFYSGKSQENLTIFCSELRKNSVKIYLWFLDSYGNKQFDDLFKEYKQIIDDLGQKLAANEIQYDGLVIDMEWINRPFGNNNSKYLKILSYLKKQYSTKNIRVFASLVDDAKENSRRGFDETMILQYADNIIPMLYISDGGFRTDYGFVIPLLQDWRITQLKKYYENKGYIPAYSVERAILIKRWGKVIFIPNLYYQNVIPLPRLKHRHTTESYYYAISRNKLPGAQTIDYKGKKIKLRKGKSVFLLTPSPAFASEPCFIWEYLYTKH